MYALATDVSTVDTEYGVVLLHEVRGEYWNLNPTGATVLRVVTGSGDLGRAVDELVAEYAVSRAVAEQDVDGVVAQLVSAGLLVPIGSTS